MKVSVLPAPFSTHFGERCHTFFTLHFLNSSANKQLNLDYCDHVCGQNVSLFFVLL